MWTGDGQWENDPKHEALLQSHGALHGCGDGGSAVNMLTQ